MTVTESPLVDGPADVLETDQDPWKRRLRDRTIVIRLVQAMLLGGFLAAWELLTGNPKTESWALIDEFYVGKPSKAFETLSGWIEDGSLWAHVGVTLKETLYGFALGCLAGLLVGFGLGVSPFASRVFSPFIMAAYAVPRLALAPLFLLWFGLGTGSKVALVTTVVFFLVFFNTYSGVREVDKQLVDVLRVMRASRWQVHRRVTIPSAMVWVIAGLRVSVPYAFVAAVVGERVAARQGLGLLIQRSSSSFNPSGMFAAISVLVVMAVILNGVVSLIERSTLKWKVATEHGPH